MTISEKVAYLKGLAEGLNIDTEKSKEGKLISVMIGILEEIGMSIEDLEENAEALGEEIDAISDDLSDVEKAVFDDEDEDDDDCCCDDDDFFEVDCPNCGETLMIDESVLEEGVIQCPGCKQKFALDLSDDCCCEDEDDDCGCGCGCEDHDHEE
ncbi:CD1247 N-terminal domain-containing protein [Flavonifractor sp. HCP28S3_F3]|uniref:CD1247 N-terminal domain-containing protein n=1 Tax=Flavonifractor sp. HCP28S3_F3 TaxID=3438939 RepID=UPI003F8AA495